MKEDKEVIDFFCPCHLVVEIFDAYISCGRVENSPLCRELSEVERNILYDLNRYLLYISSVLIGI